MEERAESAERFPHVPEPLTSAWFAALSHGKNSRPDGNITETPKEETEWQAKLARFGQVP
jgi:hypothetical protein